MTGGSVSTEGAVSTSDFAHFFEVNLELFEGPIDLLLHLVKREELPIEKVSLAQVTTQYLACIERLKHFDFDIAGEYLVIAATLLSIKSSVLLNEPAEPPPEEESNEGDPTQELLRRMQELEIFRKRAAELAARDLLGIDVFPAAPSTGAIVSEVRYRDHDPMLLGQAFRKLLQKSGESSSFIITVDPVSIADRMMTIVDLLRDRSGAGRATLRFDEVVTDRSSVNAIISSFIALLELCKRLVIRVKQDKEFDEILIALSEFEIAGVTLESEFDLPAVADGNGVEENGAQGKESEAREPEHRFAEAEEQATSV